MSNTDLVTLVLGGAFAAGVVGLVVSALGDHAVRRWLRGSARPRAGGRGDDPLPPVTLLKPVKGLDEGFAENLRSFLAQDYPELEILVGAASASDPALLLARRMALANPQVALRTVVCPEDGGLNPKVSILRTLSRHAKSDLVLISDSNVRVQPDYVGATVRELADPKVGLVTNPIAGAGEQSAGARFEGLHLATFVARALAFADVFLGRACVVGKSMLFRLSDFQRLGGWASVRDVLAEDYLIGHAFQRAGFRVAVSPHVVFNHNERWPLGRFVNRHLRWGQMRRRTSLGAYLLEPLSNPNALFVLVGLGAAAAEMPRLALLAALGVAVRLGLDWQLLVRMRRQPVALPFLLLAVPKDLLWLAMWVVAAFRRSIDWRGRRFLIGAGTRLEPAPRAVPVAAAAPAVSGVNEAV